MEKLLILAVTLATCWAKLEGPQDMSGKVFVFPKETATDHVKLITRKTQFNSATVCLRFLTDLSRTYGIFSMATPSQSNGFLIYREDRSNTIELAVQDKSLYYFSQSFPPNSWHSMCATWRSDNGLGQMWVNGKPSVKKFIQTGPIVGAPITILGQEQDAYGGRFDQGQSFVGMITEVHMWDSVVPPAELKRYANGKSFAPGNVFNWKNLEYEITGQILVEEESTVM